MKKLSRQAEGDNHERWLVSYADFITLLFAFFVVMYSISSINESKYRIFSESLSIAFIQPLTPTTRYVDPGQLLVTPGTPMPQTSNILVSKNKVLVDKRTAQLGEEQRKIEERMKKLAGRLNQVMAALIKQRSVNIDLTRRGVVVDISASTLFDTGAAVLHASSLGVLRAVAEVLSKESLLVEVEGHTDDTPIATAQFPSNWELSSVRASSVVRILIENGVPEKRLAVVGLASNHPLAPNDSAGNRSKNRRVTITIASPNLDRD